MSSRLKWKCPWCPTLVKDDELFVEHLKKTHPGRYQAEPDAKPVEWFTTPPPRVKAQGDIPGQGLMFDNAEPKED